MAADVADLVELVDTTAGEAVLVLGALPPEGRDLDLLVRPAAEERVAAALSAAGYLRRGMQWVLFADGTAQVVDLVPTAAWSLPSTEVERLYAEARPLAARRALAEPDAVATLLVVARKLARGGALTSARRDRVAGALAIDPDAWTGASQRAPHWGLTAALATLRSAFEARGEDTEQARPPEAPWRLRARRWRRRPRIVTFSGLDGAGKTSQADALAAALTRLGYDVAIEWTRITHDRAVLDRVGLPAKRLVPRRGPVLTWLWTFVVAWANASSQRRAARRHPGAIVIHDRYTLDSAAHLRATYGADRRFRAQIALIRLLSPRPLAAFFLDVAPETAHRRKPEKYTVARLSLIADLYRAECGRLGVTRLDGERPPTVLSSEIAAAVWARLG